MRSLRSGELGIGKNTTPHSHEESLAQLEEEITSCRRCPRLVEWREKVAREKRAAYSSQTYWGRPVPGFGDPRAEVVILGLAPAAHGANRTGRFFTGDRSGDFLFAALHRAGFANSPISRHREDGHRLSGAWISAAVRCAPPQNRPTPSERDACLPYAARELKLLDAKVVVCLGAFAWDAAVRIFEFRPKPRFAHEAEVTVGGVTLLGCYHPSQQNTFTGVLTPAMLEAILMRARGLVVRNRPSHRIE